MPKTQFKSNWISSNLEGDFIPFAEDFGKYLCDPNDRGFPGREAMTTSQIRNFFGEVKRIQLLIRKKNNKEDSKQEKEKKDLQAAKTSFLLLKPKLAYAVARVTARNSRSRIKAFKKVIDQAHEAVDTNDLVSFKKSFQNFVDMLEAILAYHKAHGGRD